MYNSAIQPLKLGVTRSVLQKWGVCTKLVVLKYVSYFNLLEPEFYIQILAHPVGKIRIIQVAL